MLAYEACKRTYQDKIMPVPLVRELEAKYPGFILLAAEHMFPISIGPGECVYERGVGHRRVFFIRAGAVEVIDANDTVVETLSSGNSFGEGALAVPFGCVFQSRYAVYTTL